MKSQFSLVLLLVVAMVHLGASQCTCNQCTCSYTGAQECVAPVPRCPDLYNLPAKFQLKGKQSGKCLSLDTAANRFEIQPCGTATSATFSAVAASPSGWFRLKLLTQLPGRCVYSVNFVDANYNEVHSFDCEETATHNWRFNCADGNQYVQLIGHGARCVNVGGAKVDDGTNVLLYDCLGEQPGNDRWEIVPVA